MENNRKARVIAFYLPQFHQIPENDEWWGDGFTDWTSVKNAIPLYKGHEQPKIPAELGYYNLLEANARDKQAELAKAAGIEGFCYWHYWFGDGKCLLEKPFDAVLTSGKPNFPFCLGWANESWNAKVWGEKGKSDRLLVEQKYPGEADNLNHFYNCLSAFKDSRYIKIDEKPVFLIYKPMALPQQKEFIKMWNELALENGLKGIFFIGHTHKSIEIAPILSIGFDAINIVRTGEWLHNKKFLYKNIYSLIRYKLLNKPYIISYKKIIKLFTKPEDSNIKVYPTIIPNWDHTPRSGKRGYLYHGSTPELFKKHIETVFASVKNKPLDKQIVFLKSWNEWGEGNYMEPDSKFGRAYINTLNNALKNFNNKF
jgi:lipopolysaccharide biosynthesis protein